MTTRRDELLGAGVFAALGAVIAVASWRMDRLADRGIEAWSVPGLLPGLVGALMIVLSLVLGWQARRQPVGAAEAAEAPSGLTRAALALLLCVLFAGISLEGSTLRPDNRANEKLYGRKLSAREIVRQGKAGAPASAQQLLSLLNTHSPKNRSNAKSLQ